MPNIVKMKVKKFNDLYTDLSDFLNRNFNPDESVFRDQEGIKKDSDVQLTHLKNEFKKFQRARNPKKPHNIFVIDSTLENSLLHNAAGEGNNLLLRFLINAGLNIDCLNAQHETALYTACLNLQEKSVDLLLNSGADYDAHLRGGKKSPLYITLDPENTALNQEEKIKAANILKKLIDKGVDINQPLGRRSQFRAIHYAVMDRRTLLVRTIVESGKADLNIVDVDGKTVLHMIADYRDQDEKARESLQMEEEREITRLIIPHIDAINKQDKDGNTPLHTAVINSNVLVVDEIVKRDHLFAQMKILNIKNKQGRTALHEAVLEARRGPKILDLLIRLATEDELAIKSDIVMGGRGLIGGETALEMSKRLFAEAQRLPGLAIRLDIEAKIFDMIRSSLHDPEWKDKLGKQVKTILTCLDQLYSVESEELLASKIKNVYGVVFDFYEHLMNGNIPKDLTLRAQKPSDKIKELVVHINQYFDNGYLHVLNNVEKSLEQTDFIAWRNQQLNLESSFKDLDTISPNYNAELTQANGKFFEAQQFLRVADNDNAQKKLEESIDLYDSLKDYASLEIAHQYLASTYINIGKTADYEMKNKLGLQFSADSTKLHSHFALAGLYKVLKARNLFLPLSVSAADLSAYESFHYSEAYKITQGNLDKDARVVLQREIGVANNAKLGTFNIQQCVAIIAHDPGTGKVVLSHFDRYSGPLKFIDQILNEFPAGSKVDLYLTGGRDRGTTVSFTSTTKVSDNNINQVLKQIYANKERFNIKASDLGDKPSPEAVVFNPHSAQLEHRMPNCDDISLDSRAARMSIELNNQILQKGDYLHPLNRIDFSQDETTRKISFSAAQLQTMKDQYHRYENDYSNRAEFTEAWKHNQLFYPLIATVHDITGNPYDFHQGLFEAAVTNNFSPIQLPFDIDMFALQQNMQQHPNLINEIYIQSKLNPLHASIDQPVDSGEAIYGNEFDDISTDEGIDIDDIDMEPPNKRICLSNRRRREAETCSFSWDDIDKINLEKEKPRDIERINIDSSALLEHLKAADELTRSQLLQVAASCRMTGDRQLAVRSLIHMEHIKPHLQKMSKISSGLTQGFFAEDALADLLKGNSTTAINLAVLMGVSHGLGELSEWITKNEVNKALKLSTPFLARGTSILNGFDLAKQVGELKSGNKDAMVGVVGDSINIGIDLGEAGIEIAELNSEMIATLGFSEVTGPVGEVGAAFVMLGMKIFSAVRSVTHLVQLVPLSGWEKLKEGSRAFLGMFREAYIQQIVDLIEEYNRVFLEKVELFKSHPEFKHIIFQTIEKIGQNCRVVIGERVCTGEHFRTCHNEEETVCDPVFAVVQNSSVRFDREKQNNPPLTREIPSAPAGTQFDCLPTANYLRSSAENQCAAAIDLMNIHSKGNIAFFDLGIGTDTAMGYRNQPNFFMVRDGFKKYIGGKEADLFFIQGSKIQGDFDGGEGIDTLDISGLQSGEGPIEIRLNNYMEYGNTSLGLRGIENLIDESTGILGEKSVFVACETTNLKLQDGTRQTHNKIHIPQNDDCHYKLNLTLQAHTDVFHQAKKGSFRYNVQPKNGDVTVYFSIHTPAFPELSQHQFVFDAAVSDLASLDHKITTTAVPPRHHIKFHFLNHEARQFLRAIQAVSIEESEVSGQAKIHYQFRPGFALGTNMTFSLSKEFLKEHFKEDDAKHFNVTLSNRQEIYYSTLKLLENTHVIKTKKLKLNIESFLTSNTFFYFKTGEQLKIGNKNIYLFSHSKESVENIINTYLIVANRLKITCIIHTFKNEIVVIGHDKHEVMRNDPTASTTHLLGNGGENMFVVDSGAVELTSLPLSDVHLYHLESGNHIDTLDLRALNAKVQARLGIIPEIVFVAPDERNKLGKDLLLLLTIKSRGTRQANKIMSIRLKNGITWYHKLHTILNSASQKIVGSLSSLRLEPVPLILKKHHEIISVGSRDVEEHTEIHLARKFDQLIFFRDGDHLRLTNTLNFSKKIKPSTILFENYYTEPKLATLSIKFSDDKTIVLADRLAEISAAPNFKEKWTTRQKALAAIAFNQTNRVYENENKPFIEALSSRNHSSIHSISERETQANSIEGSEIVFRQRRSVELPEAEPIDSSAAPGSRGVLQSGVNTIKDSMNSPFLNNVEKNTRDRTLKIADDFYDRWDRLKPTRKKDSKLAKKNVVSSGEVKSANNNAKSNIQIGTLEKNSVLPNKNSKRIGSAHNKICKRTTLFKQEQTRQTYIPQTIWRNKQNTYANLNHGQIKVDKHMALGSLSPKIENQTRKYLHSQSLLEARLAGNNQHGYQYTRQHSEKLGISQVTARSSVDTTLFLISVMSRYKYPQPLSAKAVRLSEKADRQTQKILGRSRLHI